jgi:hypothetical protein
MYVYMSAHYIHHKVNVKATNKPFENVAYFKYFGTAVTDQNYIHEEVRGRLSRGMLANVQFSIFCFRICRLKT